MNSWLLALGFSVAYLLSTKRGLVVRPNTTLESKRREYDDSRSKPTIGGDGTTSLGIRDLVESPLCLVGEEPWHDGIEASEKERIISLLRTQVQQQIAFDGPASAPTSVYDY